MREERLDDEEGRGTGGAEWRWKILTSLFGEPGVGRKGIGLEV